MAAPRHGSRAGRPWGVMAWGRPRLSTQVRTLILALRAARDPDPDDLGIGRFVTDPMATLGEDPQGGVDVVALQGRHPAADTAFTGARSEATCSRAGRGPSAIVLD